MEPTFQELIIRLEGIQTLYQQLLELAGNKQQELVKGNLERIEALTKEEENLVYQAGRLEDERYKFAGRLFSHFGLREEATLKELIGLAPVAEQAKLQALHQNMGQLIAQMDKMSQENITLIQQSLRFINFTVDVLTKPDDTATYGSGIEKNSNQDNISRILDKKI